jgi:hypothetical protein
MKDYVLKEKSEPASNEMVWAFDLGKGSIGEAVRRGNEFLHKASLLIPAELGRHGPAKDSGTPAANASGNVLNSRCHASHSGNARSSRAPMG